jgi:PadR family transcriptional regulator, regulatory protein PadR
MADFGIRTAVYRHALNFDIWIAYTYVEGRGMTAKSDLPQGTLDLLVLQVLTLEPLHGYAIAQRLKQMSRDVVQVTQGTLYPALHRLENRGFLSADWKASDTGRDAKFYRLTRKGRAHLEAEMASWERLTGAIAAILNAAKGEAS